MAVPEQRYTPVLHGAYRNDPSPMQIVSGPYGRERVHHETPPAIQLPDEMVRPIDGYNQTSPLRGDKTLPGIVRAGIAHLWFEVIHPCDDGNGRVGRVIADHALSRSLGYPATACLATAIEGDKKTITCNRRKPAVEAWMLMLGLITLPTGSSMHRKLPGRK